jgi:hypothetical protein
MPANRFLNALLQFFGCIEIVVGVEYVYNSSNGGVFSTGKFADFGFLKKLV